MGGNLAGLVFNFIFVQWEYAGGMLSIFTVNILIVESDVCSFTKKNNEPFWLQLFVQDVFLLNSRLTCGSKTTH